MKYFFYILKYDLDLLQTHFTNLYQLIPTTSKLKENRYDYENKKSSRTN